MSKGVKPGQIVDKYQKPNTTSMSPTDFKRTIEHEFRDVPDVMSRCKDIDFMKTLVYYLAKEEKSRVSYAKLR